MKYSLALISSFAAVCLTGPVENAVAKPQPTQQPMSEDELLELKIAARVTALECLDIYKYLSIH